MKLICFHRKLEELDIFGSIPLILHLTPLFKLSYYHKLTRQTKIYVLNPHKKKNQAFILNVSREIIVSLHVFIVYWSFADRQTNGQKLCRCL